MRTRAYIAGRYSRREEFNQRAEELREVGYVVDCRWLLGTHQYGPDSERAQQELGEDVELAQRFAEEDVEDLYRSDIVVSFTETPRVPSTNRGGRHVELGLALGLGKMLVIVGPRENAFHYLREVAQFDSWREALAALTALVEP